MASWHPIHFATSVRNFSILHSILLSAPSEVNAVTDQGITPLHIASALGEILCLVLLLKFEADVNAMNKTGETPMAIAQTDDIRDILGVFAGDVPKQNPPKKTPQGNRRRGDKRRSLASYSQDEIFERFLGSEIGPTAEPIEVGGNDVIDMLAKLCEGVN
jgi:ankyrin repeat protein